MMIEITTTMKHLAQSLTVKINEVIDGYPASAAQQQWVRDQVIGKLVNSDNGASWEDEADEK